MTEGSLDVRESTLNALKLWCPSAEVLTTESEIQPMENPFLVHEAETPSVVDSENEWSDEEELIPKRYRKTRDARLNNGGRLAELAVNGDNWGQSSQSSGDNSPNIHTPNIGTPSVPPKSASRPRFDPGSSQDDLVERFYQVTRERDALRQQLRKSTPNSGRNLQPFDSKYSQKIRSETQPPRSERYHKSEERTMIEELQALRYEIRNWSERYFSGVPKKRQNRPSLYSSKELFGNLTDNYATYLKHPNERPLLVQAYLWSKLQVRIFSNHLNGCGYVWAGKLGDRKLRPINDTLRRAVKNEDDAEEYHHWRALTVNLLVPQVDGKWRPKYDTEPVLKWISKFSSRTRRKLRPWATQSLRLGKEELKTIVSAAVALDLKFKRQRADYRFVTFTGGKTSQQYGYPFYDSEMEDVDEEDDKPRRVELSLAPALERCGNANGYVYDQSFILVKADVSCKHVAKSGRSSRSTRKPKGSVTNRMRSILNF
ncbi:hypothetical protein K432DRAFT_417812 [Lepidopterella palustris CBS 459.81]|uniref:Uncharacterized protein n=1 Tax=Lepidopterella palustris CBS 459.81 TaxID=1314670 RepID=A0A8E2JDM5_9PEZI|nr:hypothetical protein K432DRAFT_417812 [Lepidopterella palustris CBS 459.81]